MHYLTLPKKEGLLLVFLLCTVSLFAQFELYTQRPDAGYAPGETADFVLFPQQSGYASYKFKYDNIQPVIRSGNINVTAGVPAILPFQSAGADVVLCEVNLNGVTKTAAAVFGRDNLPLHTEEPADFDSFWQNQKNIAHALPLDPQLIWHTSDGNTITWRISLANIDNRRLYGYISVPVGGNNLPAVITLPPFGESANIAQPESFIADRANAISVSLSSHNAPADAVDPQAYLPDNINSTTGYYYRYALLGAVRMIDYLFTRPEFDGQNIILTGVSQGGGLALMTAGLDSRVKALTISNPALCGHGGYDNNRASGFPQYLNRSNTVFNNGFHYSQTLAASRYYDAAFFASRFQGHTLAAVSYADEVTPAASSFPALNRLRGKTVITHAVQLNHTHPSAYWNGRHDLWRNAVPTTVNFPHTATGYDAAAGSDRTTTAGTPIDLAGSIKYNGAENYSFPTEWTSVAGPGQVTFGNASARNTTAVFSTPGVYTLRFRAKDTGTLTNEKIFHTAADFLTVTVGGGTNGDNGQSDTASPNSTLTFAGHNPDGSFQTAVIFNEPVTGLTADDFSIQNGSPVGLYGSNDFYYLTVQPAAVGTVRINLPYGKCRDDADNPNLPSNQLNIEIYYLPDSNVCDNFTAGGSITGDESRCTAFAAGTIESLAPPTGGSGSVEYRWLRAASLSSAWQVIPGATSAAYNPGEVNATAYFVRTARRSGCEDYTAWSNPVVKEVTAAADNPTAPTGYCAMQGDNPDAVFISKVELENLSHASDREGYGDFTDQAATLAPGGVYLARLTPGNQSISNKWVGWIDFNRDGDFNDDRELIIFKEGNTAADCFFELPPNVATGATRMRIALRGDNFASPCYSYAQGEVEDYTVIIGTPSGGGNNNPAPESNADYCAARGLSPWWQWISRVQFADLDHTSFKDMYGNFVDRFASVEKGGVYEISLTPDFAWQTAQMYWKVWIDWNGDGDFTDTGETAAEGNTTGAFNTDVAVPFNAPSGVTRMRVGMQDSPFSAACGDLNNGEYEDYSVRITGCDGGNGRFSALLDLTAYAYEHSAEVHWSTNTEFKNAYFVLERSADDADYAPIAEQISTGDGYLPNVYRATDDTPLPGENFYRIKQIYDNGSFLYSDPQRVWYGIDPAEVIPFPNPASDLLYLPLQNYADTPTALTIYDTFARPVRFYVLPEPGTIPEEIDLTGLPDGLYYVTIEAEGRRTLSRAFTIFRL